MIISQVGLKLLRSVGRSENANNIIKHVEKLKKAERTGIEHSRIQKEYNNMDWDFEMKFPQKRADVTSPTYGYWGETRETCDTKYFPNHPLFKSIKTTSDKNYRKRHAILNVKNNDFVDSYQLTLLKSKDKGLMKVNFKDGSSKIIGKYEFNGKSPETTVDNVILPAIHKYTPESQKYPNESIKYLFIKPQ